MFRRRRRSSFRRGFRSLRSRFSRRFSRGRRRRRVSYKRKIGYRM